VKTRAFLLATLAAVPFLAGPGPARAASPTVDDAMVLWDWMARTVATVARCADYDFERRDQHLAVLDRYFGDVKDAQDKIESILLAHARQQGSRNPARETAALMDAAINKARAVVDEENQGHDIRFIKNVCKTLAADQDAGTALFQPLADRFPDEAKALRWSVP